MKASEDKNYLETLKERAKKSHVYRKYQMTGLIISRLLNDEKHKSLYIKLAKQYNEEELIRLAKNVAERRNVKNKGAYFMVLIKNLKIKNQNDKSKSKNSNNKQ